MVMPDVPLLNWNQQMGILLVFPLVGHFVVQLLGGGQVGSMMWTLVATKLLTIQSMQTPTFSKNLTCIEKRFLAVKHWNLVEALTT